MVETVEEEELYEIVANTNTNSPVMADANIEDLEEDESDGQPLVNPTTAQQLLDSTQPYDPMRDEPPPPNAGPSYRPF